MTNYGPFVQVDSSQYEAVMRQVQGAAWSQPQTMGYVGLLLEQFARGTFRKQTDPWGVPWPALSQVTLDQRALRGSQDIQKLIDETLGPPIMLDTVTHGNDDHSAWVSVGEDLPDPRAPVQQFGNPANLAWGGPPAPIPARPMLPMRTPTEVDPPNDWLQAVFAPIVAAMDKATQL